jgi:glycosyltransferase involved in cell wall biosynthesis
VDNNSTDKTTEFVKEFNDSRIKLFKNETNIGLIPNWNKAIEHSTGTYIKILPADDLLLPDCLKLQVEILEKDLYQSIALVCGKRNIIDKNGKVLFTRGFSGKSTVVSGTRAINKVIRSGGNSIGEGGAVMFRRSILEKTGMFNSSIFYVLDLDLWFKILLHGNLYALPDIVCAFRISGSSSSVKVVKKQKEDYFNFIRKIYHTKEYKLSLFNYRIGLLFTFVLTEIKKLIYRFVV